MTCSVPRPGLNVLYVEDNDADAALVRESLAQAMRGAERDFAFTRVPNMAEALIILRHTPFNIILLDLNLPDTKGIQNVEIIRRQNPDIPVVVLTGTDNDQLAAEVLEAGAQEYLAKNYSTGPVLKRILYSGLYHKKHEDDLYHKAHYDSLTGLPNRMFFEDVTGSILAKADRWRQNAAFLFIDLDRFKEINDTYGHEVGNCVLSQIARRLQKALRKSDIIARYAGDEFVVCLDDDGHSKLDRHLCHRLARKIAREVEKPVTVRGHMLPVSISLGVAIYPEDGMNFQTLLEKADEDMYRQKQIKKKEQSALLSSPLSPLPWSAENARA